MARLSVASGGILETVGYLASDARSRIDAAVCRPRTYLVDIRLVPYSRWYPQWTRPALQERYGKRYVHLRGLGNVNYRDRRQPICLLDPEPHVQHLAEELRRGTSSLLLCACTDEMQCHRRVVFALILQALADQSQVARRNVLIAPSLWETYDDQPQPWQGGPPQWAR
jgi:hypothetical protein